MLHNLACNQFRFTPPILLQMGVFLYPSTAIFPIQEQTDIHQVIQEAVHLQHISFLYDSILPDPFFQKIHRFSLPVFFFITHLKHQSPEAYHITPPLAIAV